LLSAPERALIESSDTFGSDAVQIWAQVRGYTQDRAVLDMANGLGWMQPKEYEWFLAELGEPEQPRGVVAKPEWNSRRHQLRYEGKKIRDVRAIATNIIMILDAFQKQSWPDRIADPLPGPPDSQRLRGAIYKFNQGGGTIQLRADGSGLGSHLNDCATAAHRRWTHKNLLGIIHW
jgi:hypothetical protein